MRKFITLFVLTILFSNIILRGQPIQKTDSVPTIEKAQYLKENLGKVLLKNVRYPIEALENKTQGDVVFSFSITHEGKMENIIIISPFIPILSPSALKAINQLDKKWIPANENGKPIDKRYTIVYRYRITYNGLPLEDKKEADEYFKTKNYKKALKSINAAINDNPYDYRFFEFRSQVKQLLGDIEGSKQDHKTSLNLNSDIMMFGSIYQSSTTIILNPLSNKTSGSQF